MTTFDDREAAFENQFAHDEKMKFAATARACNRVAIWVANSIGLTGQDADSYAKSLVASDLQEPGHEDFLNRLRADLRGRVPDAELNKRMDLELSTALEEIRSDASLKLN